MKQTLPEVFILCFVSCALRLILYLGVSDQQFIRSFYSVFEGLFFFGLLLLLLYRLQDKEVLRRFKDFFLFILFALIASTLTANLTNILIYTYLDPSLLVQAAEIEYQSIEQEAAELGFSHNTRYEDVLYMNQNKYALAGILKSMLFGLPFQAVGAVVLATLFSPSAER
jgi:hypothetical protein